MTKSSLSKASSYEFLEVVKAYFCRTFNASKINDATEYELPFSDKLRSIMVFVNISQNTFNYKAEESKQEVVESSLTNARDITVQNLSNSKYYSQMR